MEETIRIRKDEESDLWVKEVAISKFPRAVYLRNSRNEISKVFFVGRDVVVKLKNNNEHTYRIYDKNNNELENYYWLGSN